MRKTSYFFLGLMVWILTACNGRKIASQLDNICYIANSNPDSALVLLNKFKDEEKEWNRGDRIHYELTKMHIENKKYVTFSSDSTIKEIVGYYKNSGTANEKMLAYYILGRVYSDIGEAPKALEAYYDAINMADTTSSDCDYNTLIGIYGQMSTIFHKQNLPHDEIWALKHYIDYIRKHEDLKEYIIEKEQLVRPYYLLNEKDSVLSLINKTYSALKQLGEDQAAADALVVSIYIYTERGELAKAKQAIDIFEKESGLFDKYGNIKKGREAYYNTKGFYELAVKNIDSAEQYFRKAIKYGYNENAYKGLLSVYRESGNLDSVVHYSILYESSLDSIHNKKQIETIHQMSSLYNYNRIQREAEMEAKKVHKAHFLIICILFLVVIGTITFLQLYIVYRNKKRKEISKLANSLFAAQKEYQIIQEELQKLKSSNIETIIAYKEQQGELLKQTILKLSNADKQSGIIDNLCDFEKSKIVELFRKKEDLKLGAKLPSKAEWRALEMQFSKNMPNTYKILANDKKLSPLELRVCILLMLDFEDCTIVNLTGSMSQTISTAKSRANKKLFNKRGAYTLKSSLVQMTKNL
jgi:tetratricopeptide (TPR) repeat protein